jgi:hypothetical protein
MTTKDPVTGRPLHEFVVDPLAAPTGLPTEGTPTDEPGVQQAPHGKPRRSPVLVVTIDPRLDTKTAAKQLAEVIRDARLKLDKRRQG